MLIVFLVGGFDIFIYILYWLLLYVESGYRIIVIKGFLI